MLKKDKQHIDKNVFIYIFNCKVQYYIFYLPWLKKFEYERKLDSSPTELLN